MEHRTSGDWLIPGNPYPVASNVQRGGRTTDEDLLMILPGVNPWATTQENHRVAFRTNTMGSFYGDDLRPSLVTLDHSFPYITSPNFGAGQLEDDFNQLTLSNPPSGLGPLSRGMPTLPANNYHHQPSVHHGGGNGCFRATGSDNATIPMGGGHNVYLGGPRNFSPCYPGTHFSGGHSENLLRRMRVESAVRGRLRPSDYMHDSNPNHPNLNQYPHSNLYYNHLLNNPTGPNRPNGSSLSSTGPYSSSSSSSLSNRGTYSRGHEDHHTSIIPSSLHNSISQGNNNFSSMEDLEGNVYLRARSQRGCQNLEKLFEEGQPEEIQMIFSQVKGRVHELMKHQSWNFMIQKMFDVFDVHQITELLHALVSDERRLMDVCTDNQGTRAMQKLLECLTSLEQRYLVLSCLRRITLGLTKDGNGYHVIERCFDLFPGEDTKQILNIIADNCLEIAADKSGCCLLQCCVFGEDVEPLDRIVADITANALTLSRDQYGNFVVQYIVGLKLERATKGIVAQLSGSFVSLSFDKYGSHVVEKCLNFCSEDQVTLIIEEMINSQDFLGLLQDPYGNFVAQTAFGVSKGSTRAAMIDLIQNHYLFLHSHPHGKRVLDKVGLRYQGRKLLEASKTGRNHVRYGKA